MQREGLKVTVDRARFVQGSARYVSNLHFEAAAWLSVVRSDLAHGRVEGIDTTLAADVTGVLAVLTAADLDEVPSIPMRVGATPTLQGRLQPVIASDRVRYVGEPLAVVVAESADAAAHAAGLVMADIAPLVPATGTPGGKGRVWDDLDEDVLVDIVAAEGNLEAAFSTARTVIDVDFATARKTGLPLEPRGLTARWDDGKLNMWGPTKFVHFTRRTLASMFAIAESDVVCHRVDVGGMFGVRGEFYPEDFLVPWAAKVVGRTMRWVEPRRQHMVAIHHAGGQRHQIRLGLDGAGRPIALEADVVIDAGAYARPTGSRIAHIVAETMAGPYAWEAFSVRCRTVATHRTPTGTVRGPAAFETTFSRERALDIAAKRGGHDPLHVRRSGLISPEAIPFQRQAAADEPPVVFDSGDFAAVLDGLLEQCGYAAWLSERDHRRAGGETIGLGIGLFVIHSALGGEESVGVDLGTEGRFQVRTSATDVGQGLDRMAAMKLAADLGISSMDVDVWSGDTAAHGAGKGTYSSRSTVFVANALTHAANLMRAEAAVRSVELLGCELGEVTFDASGPVTPVGSLDWKELAPISVEGRFTMDHPTYGFGAHVSLVAVDRESGVVKPERMAVAYDCGHALDPTNVADQLRGAAVAGIGGALYEQIPYDGDGAPQTTTLSDYLIPTGLGLPTIDVFIFESAPARGNPLGLKGVGEAGLIGVGASIANAVADALGEAGADLVRALPIDRESIALASIGGSP